MEIIIHVLLLSRFHHDAQEIERSFVADMLHR